MKYSDFILKHFVVYALIGGLLPFLIVKNEVFNIDDRIVAFPLIMICYAHFYYQKRLSKISRVGDLKEYSKLKNYDFIEKPSESDLDDFATFETLPLIMDKGDKDAFMNLLTHSQRQELYSAEKPKIITVRKTHTTAMVNRGDREILFTQVFLLKSKKEIPHFYLAPTSFFSLFGGIGEKLVYPYKKINVEKYNFPVNKYNLYAHDKSTVEFFSSEFIDLLNKGLEKNKKVSIESDGNNIIFYLLNERFSGEGITFHTNLFQVLYKALNN
jgi:hypothetical protein